MEQLPWPSFSDGVNLLDQTHFNAMVRPRDDTARVIAATLNAMPYARVHRKKRVKRTPQEIAAKEVARLMKQLSKHWPDPDVDARILAALEGEPLSPTKRMASPKKSPAMKVRIDLPRYGSPAATPTKINDFFPLYDLAVADPVTYHDLHTPKSPQSPLKSPQSPPPKSRPNQSPQKRRRKGLNERFATFLAKQARDPPDEMEDEPLLESAEMIQRRKAMLAMHTEPGLHSNAVTSTLAVAVDSRMAYCHPDVMKKDPNAAASLGSPLKTSEFAGANRRRQAKWEEVQGEEARRIGDDAAATRHLNRAAQLNDGIEEDDEEPTESGQVMVYSIKAHVAAIRIQRNFRRHLRLVIRGIDKVKAFFRGRQQRLRDTAEARRERAAARFLQRPARRWWRNRCRAVLKLQTKFRARKARRIVEDIKWRKKFLNFLTNMGPVLAAWLRRWKKNREDKTARFLQHVWRTARIRGEYHEKVAEKQKRRFDASALLQGVLRRRWGAMHVAALKDQARQDEALRAATELYWVRGAATLSKIRYDLDILKPTRSLKAWLRTADKRKFDGVFAEADVEGTRQIGYQEALGVLRRFGIRWSPKLLVDMDPHRVGRIDVDTLWDVAESRRCCSCLPSFFPYRRRRRQEAKTLAGRPAVRRVLMEFRSRDPPAFECPACRAAFPLFSQWWRHFDAEGRCVADWIPIQKRARPIIDWRSARSMGLLERGVLDAVTRYFDEGIAVEHASTIAENVAAMAKTCDPAVRSEANVVAVAFRKRIHLVQKQCPRPPRRCFCRAEDKQAEVDVRNGVAALDVRGRGFVNRDDLTMLFVVLATKSDAKARAREATEAVFDLAAADGKTEVVDADTVVRWWSSHVEMRRNFAPGRLYKRRTPVVLAHMVLAHRGAAVAQRDEVMKFRRLVPLSNPADPTLLHDGGLDYLLDPRYVDRGTWATARAAYAIESVAVLRDFAAHPTQYHPPAVSTSDLRIRPVEAPAPPASSPPPPQKKKEEFDEVQKRRRILYRAWHPAAVVGAIDDTPTEAELIDAERGAERFIRRRLRTASGKLALAAERTHYEAMASLVVDENDRLEECALIALPYDAAGRGFLNARDIVDTLVPKRLRRHLDPEAPVQAKALFPTTTPSFVTFSVFLDWCATRLKEPSHGTSCSTWWWRPAYRDRAVDAIVTRERALARGRLLELDDALEARRRGHDRAVVERKVIEAADAQWRRMSRGRIFRNYVTWDLFFCTAMEANFASLAATSSSRDAALKQAEYWFTLYDIDNDGAVSPVVLESLLGHMGITLAPHEALVAATEISGEPLVQWSMLHRWLATSRRPQVLKRLDAGWIPMKHRLRRHAKLRLRLANRHRALAQLDVILALEAKWDTLSEVQTTTTKRDVVEPESESSSSKLVARLERAREMSAVHHRQRLGPFNDPTAMLAYTEKIINRGIQASVTFAQEYLSTRASLVRTATGGGVQYDESFSEAAMKAENLMMAKKKKKDGAFPVAWTFWLGRAHLGTRVS